jgi:hypothetical protein
VPTAGDVAGSPEDLLLMTQREMERLEALLFAKWTEAQEMLRKFIESDLLVQDLKFASGQKASETTAFSASLAPWPQCHLLSEFRFCPMSSCARWKLLLVGRACIVRSNGNVSKKCNALWNWRGKG